MAYTPFAYQPCLSTEAVLLHRLSLHRFTAFSFADILRGKRLDKLKYWLIAEQGEPDDDARFLAAARSHQITYAAPIAKVRQYTSLYRLLRLQRLACVDQKQKLAPNDNCFYRDRPTVVQLWKALLGQLRIAWVCSR
ncbi:MAG: hypothetical protein AAF289_00240 [Cyanobacteria bacterium P01_A01_bin.135]